MTLLLVPIFVLYFALVMILIFGWNLAVKPSYNSIPSKENEPLISVIVPVRNEGQNIGNLMLDLSRQRYGHFQVIIVDDHSEDDTVEVVRLFVKKDDRFELKQSSGIGKKQALAQGVAVAAGSIIVTTDADCRVTENWINGLQQYFGKEQTMMVFGGVRMEGSSFFASVQAMEFVSLIGSGAATATFGLPTMCNGANLAFRKSAFESVNGYQGNFHIPSGDDEFLMKKIHHLYPGGVMFASDARTVVTTSANANLRQFLHQRIRWAGKWKLHQSVTSKALALFVYCFQLAVIFLLLGMALHWVSLKDGLWLLLPKIFIEYIFIRKLSGFFHVPWNWRAFSFLQLVYPFYVTGIGLIANIYSFEWKGRKLKSLMVSNT